VLTIASVLITGVSAFFATNWKMRQSQHEQAITLNAMAAHQQESTALLSQSVVALKETASSMQAVLSEQQKQLNSMMLEVEVARRIREAKNVAGDKSA
jgi:triosephosphate isomerase